MNTTMFDAPDDVDRWLLAGPVEDADVDEAVEEDDDATELDEADDDADDEDDDEEDEDERRADWRRGRRRRAEGAAAADRRRAAYPVAPLAIAIPAAPSASPRAVPPIGR